MKSTFQRANDFLLQPNFQFWTGIWSHDAAREMLARPAVAPDDSEDYVSQLREIGGDF